MRKIVSMLLLSGLVWASLAESKTLHPEKYYQERWCAEQKGQAEVVLPDKTRCDCLTATNAVEFDFGKKWAEAIGQAIYYSVQTGRKAGIVLILEGQDDYKYWIRLNTVIKQHNLNVDTWIMRPGD